MWVQALAFFRSVEIGIYVLLGIGGIFFLRRFAGAWQELQGATFGLERERAQGRLNTAASALVVLLTLAVVEFVMVSFVAPVIPGAMPLPTPTLNLLATATTTLPASAADTSLTPGANAVATGVPVFLEAPSGGCLPGQINITTPGEGDEVSGIVSIVGTADIPNFGHYIFQYKRPDETLWATISAGNEPRQESELIKWDTTRLAPGDYQLGLVLVDSQAQTMTPCVIKVRVARPPEATPEA
jgi:hypothetical protein